jgi:hypothetical protein
MKLNPEKCVFGISAGKLLGFLLSQQRIKANPDKIRAIETMRPPARLKASRETGFPVEVDGVSRSPQLLHLEASREGPPLLQADEGVWSVHMD